MVFKELCKIFYIYIIIVVKVSDLYFLKKHTLKIYTLKYVSNSIITLNTKIFKNEV